VVTFITSQKRYQYTMHRTEHVMKLYCLSPAGLRALGRQLQCEWQGFHCWHRPYEVSRVLTCHSLLL